MTIREILWLIQSFLEGYLDFCSINPVLGYFNGVY